MAPSPILPSCSATIGPRRCWARRSRRRRQPTQSSANWRNRASIAKRCSARAAKKRKRKRKTLLPRRAVAGPHAAAQRHAERRGRVGAAAHAAARGRSGDVTAKRTFSDRFCIAPEWATSPEKESPWLSREIRVKAIGIKADRGRVIKGEAASAAASRIREVKAAV